MSNSNTDNVDASNSDLSDVKIAMEKWQKVPFANRYMFRLVMDNYELCKCTLEVILGISIKKLVYDVTEKSVEVGLFSKGIRLDAYIEDADGVVYDLEMQASDDDGLAFGRRTRYYQSLIDMDQLKKGAHYSSLKKSIMIFVCCYDPFKFDLLRYTFSNMCHEKKELELGDESYKLFINAKGTVGNESEELLSFLHFINTGEAKDSFTKKLAEEVKLNHQDPKKAVTYMTIEQEIQTRELIAAQKAEAKGRAEGKAEGRAEGLLQGKLDTARKMLSKGMSMEDIIDITGLTAEQVARA